MVRLPRPVLLLGLAFSLARGAFIAPDALDALQVVPPPPAPESAAAAGERLVMVLLERNRTPEQAALAQHWEKYDVFKLVQPVLGDWADARTLPKLAAFIKDSTLETRPFTDRAKNTYARRRPHEDNPALHPAVAKPDGFSYPSGHATAGGLHAALLAAAWPERAADFAHQAELIGLSRLYGGAHYPSDIVAGRRLGEAIAREMLKSPQTQAALEAVRAEIAAAVAAHRQAA
ncbi:phosphatase PAP2 family protein [Oleiharenicola sp. Vm1]|uniref:phosphatase PAP2 family protein n=1 Tax=Oleiharenicola sp. Vm1 TaxID=3398393 RepID=UPI0039F49F29